jgi:beta-lactamase class A
MRRQVAGSVLLMVLAAACSGGHAGKVSVSTLPPTTTSSSSTSTSTSTTITTVPMATKLQSTVDAFATKQAVPFSIVVVDFVSGARVSHLASRQVLSASLYKLFVASELLRRLSIHSIDGDDPAGDSRGRTVSACIQAMIVVSDNDCGEAGLRLVGGGQLDGSLHAAGYSATFLASPQRTSAYDVALFLERARRENGQMYQLLRAQQVNDRLPKGLPPGTPIAHKTGDRVHWAHDAGVITTPRGDVLLAVLSGPWDAPCCDADHPGAGERVAFGAIAELAGEIYQSTAQR